MKILKINTALKHIPLKKPFITALRRVESIECVRVEVVCDNDLIAFGEAPATKAVTGEDIQSILASIASIKDDLLSLSPLEAIDLLHLSKIGSSAKAALDMAFISFGSVGEIQKYTVLYTDITISLNNPSTMLIDAKEALTDGMKILKLKFGSDIEHAINVTKKLSNLDAKLIIDANQAWSLEDTLQYIDAVKDLKIELIEQPVLASKLDALKIITSYSNIPILGVCRIHSLNLPKTPLLQHKNTFFIN